MSFHLYFASEENGTLYIGQTDSISRRLLEHRDGLNPGFTARNGVKLLVYMRCSRDGRGLSLASAP